MLKSVSFRGPEDSFWFVSDTHFNHKSFVWGPRGYTSAQEHDNSLIHKWNEVVKETDTVFFMGDFVMSINKAEDALKYLRRLKFANLIMLWGNHNAGVKQVYNEELLAQYNLKDVELYPLTKLINGTQKLIFSGHYLEVYVNGQHIILNHFSLRSWHKNGKGSQCLVGHSHGNDEGINEGCENGKILDVGVDKFGRPINFRELKNIMNKKKIKITDHHGDDPVEI